MVDNTRITTYFFFFFFNDTATTEIYTLSLHDALPISFRRGSRAFWFFCHDALRSFDRSEEHTSELQSRLHLVCRLLLEKKKNHVKSALQRYDRHVFLFIELQSILYEALTDHPQMRSLP